MAVMRVHPRLITAALLSASVVLFASSSLASPLAASQLFLARSSDTSWGYYVPGIVFVAGLIWLALYLDRRRSQKMEATATSLGLTFRRKATDTDNSLPVGCYVGNLGHGRVVSNVLEAAQTAELAFTVFDYQYTIGYGRSSQTSSQTISRMQSSLLKLPTFILFPETFFAKMGKMLGRSDINFPDSPEFSKKYILRGEDEAAIRAIFSPALRQALEPLQHLTIEGAADLLFIFRANRRTKPDALSGSIEEDKRILALFFEAQRSS
jgi:hypothetical protein